MECFDSYAVLIDEEGRFVKSANMGYEVGATVQNPVLMMDEPMIKDQTKSKVPIRLVSGLVAIAAMITLFFGYIFYQENFAPYTTIFMAINPEVEMVLNKKGEVLEVNGTNEDGRILAKNYEIISNDKTAVANDLVDRAIELGFLADGGRVSIAIDTPDQALFEEYGMELRRELDGRISITIEITDLENRNTRPNEPTPEPTPKPTVPEDDSNYDDTDYDDSDYDDTQSKPAPVAPAAPVAPPTKKTPAKPTPVKPAPKPKADTDYDDTDYDDTDYDDDDDDDTDYDDSDYDDSDYD